MQTQFSREQQALKRVDPWGMFGAFTLFIKALSGWLSLPVEVLLRWNFGEQYFSFFRAVCAYVATSLFLSLYTFIWIYVVGNRNILTGVPAAVTAEVEVIKLCTSFTMPFAVIQWLIILIRKKRGLRWWGPSPGMPLPIWKLFRLREDAIFRIFEPLLVFGVGYGMLGYNRALGWWLIVVAGALYVHHNLIAQDQQADLQEYYNNQIISKWYTKAMTENVSIHEAQGFFFMTPIVRQLRPEEKEQYLVQLEGTAPAPVPHERKLLPAQIAKNPHQHILDQLDPKLKLILDE